MQPDDNLLAKLLWRNRGQARPTFAIEPREGQESVWDDCYVDGERVRSQAGGFYGGWITNEIIGPFKGEPGTGGW